MSGYRNSTRDGEHMEPVASKSSTPRRSLNQSNQLMSQRTSSKNVEKSSSMILNNQLTDQSVIKSVHQKFCDLQN